MTYRDAQIIVNSEAAATGQLSHGKLLLACKMILDDINAEHYDRLCAMTLRDATLAGRRA